MAIELGSQFSNKAQEGNMRHIKTTCDSDLYLIHHHGGLQVNTCTILQQLAFNLASEVICNEECTKLTLRSYIHKQGPVQQRVDGLLKYNTNVCTYLVLSICHHNVKRLFGKHDFNYHNTQTCKAHAYFGTCLPLSWHPHASPQSPPYTHTLSLS